MPPRCDEYSGGGGSFPDTRSRANPGHKEGDCNRIGNAPDTPTDEPTNDGGRG
ncbi:MAG TPA: hypothetical protein VD978_12710 [Azospirillum sp.]|nr:hypothetical protein [Azospirillum sp.]